ncbi:MAG: ABC transporter ATP-binding protein [Acidimicrobiia bacterium]|nr:ABC transporter ATP-binding protein [Acidimicrobiia bacterium]
MTAAPTLALRDVSVNFGGVVALDGVHLHVEAGELCGLIGPNGAGKTTLFDVISGVRRPDRGAVALGDRDITTTSSVKRSRVGLHRTYQRAQVYGWLSVEDNVLAALEWRGGGGGLAADLVRLPARRRHERNRRERVDEVLTECGLDDVRNAKAGELPIGQARLVELARAIVEPPCLLLLDEPTSGLEERETERLGDLVGTLRDQGTAVLLVEHDVGFVMRRCDRIVVLDRGAVLAAGTPAEIRSHDAVRRAYLGAE